MWFSSWLEKPQRSTSRGRSHGSARQRRSCRPRLEILEDRTLLSTYLVNHLADDTVGSGLSGSLRYAITNAADNDHITFGVTGTINLTGVLPPLAHNIDLEGPGADQLTVRRNSIGAYPIFTVYGGATISISGLTITNGYSSSGGGGGIANSGTLTLSNSTVSGNQSRVDGGGIYNSGTLTVSHSTVSGNTANWLNLGFISFGSGGGIFNSGTLTVNDSTVSGNHVYHTGDPSGSSGDGGGIYSFGTLTVTNSTVSGNSVDGGWGPAFISENRGGGIYSLGVSTVTNSTVSGNTVAGGLFALGGGIFCDAGTLTVTNSTVSGNSVTAYSGITLGGGIGNDNGTLNMRNSILAGNTADYGPDLGGTLTSSGYNLIGNTTGGSGFVPTDLLNVNPLLGPLQNNGGPTQTTALLPGSPAINAGDNTGAPDFDQRGPGFPRIVGGTIDIGAFEVQPSAVQPSDPGFETPSVGTGTYNAFQYQPGGSPWTFSDGAGVAGNGSGFTDGNPNAPQGTQVAFLQATGSISQSLTFAAGTYSLSFSAAQRANFQSSSQTFEVRVDGTVVGTFTPGSTSYTAYTTASFTVTAGTHTLAFVGTDPDGQDNTAFIDQVFLSL